MTIPRLLALQRYWEHNPPVHVMIAAYFGIDKKPKKVEQSDMDDFFASIPQRPYERKI